MGEVSIKKIKDKLEKLKRLSEDKTNENESRVARELYEKILKSNTDVLNVSIEEFNMLNNHVFGVEIVDTNQGRTVTVLTDDLDAGLIASFQAIFKKKKEKAKQLENKNE
jgi:translation initiation factor 6 (eIF-6)